MQVRTKSPGLRLLAQCTLVCSIGATSLLSAAALVRPQAAAPVPANRFLGTITATSAGTLTVKTDAGVEHKVTVPDGIRIQRIAPGAKDLSNAAVIQFTDLAVGDRVLVRIAPEPATDPVTAVSIIAIPQADLAQKQQQEREEWQRNGVGGLVKSVDPGTGTIVITSGAGATEKTITLHTTPATILKRYAPNSVNFDDAKAAPLETIRVGDQLRARGTKNADGTEIAADAIVSGSFRNISGIIGSIDAAANTITLKDLITKQTVTIHVGAEAQMHKLPEAMATMLARMTKSEGGAGPANGGNGPARMPQANGAVAPPQGASPATGAAPGSGAGQGRGQSGEMQGARRGGDLQQMLSRAPAIHLSDLKKGDAIMLVSTEGATDVTAITLLAGVEPLLQAPASTQSMLLSNWSMSSGGAEAAQ